MMWVANAIPHPSEKRGIAIAIVNSLGNTASIYGSFLWPDRSVSSWSLARYVADLCVAHRSTAPKYYQGFGATAAFVGLGAISSQIFGLLCAKYPYQALDQSAVHIPQTEGRLEKGENAKTAV